MELVNEFTVNKPIDETWAVLTDVERIAPCLPGAQLQEIEGDVYRGVVKVKVGPIQAAFKGQASFVERDDTNHRAVLKGEGRDTGGKGNASALITARLESVSDDVTKCAVHTDLSITGKVAQFGRGAMADVSEKLMTQFATNLNTMLAAEPSANGKGSVTTPADAAPAAEAAGAETSVAVEAEPAAETSSSTSGSTADPTTPSVRRIEGPAAEPIDLVGAAGPTVIKRILPLVAGLVLLLLVLRRRKR